MSELAQELVDNILMDKNSDAQQNFQDLMAAKVTDVLDARKLEVAQQMGANNAEVQAD